MKETNQTMEYQIKKVSRKKALEILGISRSKMIDIEKQAHLKIYKFSPKSRLIFYDLDEIMNALKETTG